jgi:hypothetical protein
MSDTLSALSRQALQPTAPTTEIRIADRLEEALSPRQARTFKSRRRAALPLRQRNPLARRLFSMVAKLVKWTFFVLLFCAVGIAIWAVGLRSIVGLDLLDLVSLH